MAERSFGMEIKRPKIKSMKYEDFNDNEYLEQMVRELRENGTHVVAGCLDEVINWGRSNSLWPLTFATSCCGIEFMAVGAARYDFARFGFEVARASPRQADFIMVAGTITHKMAPVLRRLYDQMADPKYVIAVGGWLIMGEKMDYVDLITFSLYVTAFVSPIRKLANFAEMFSNGFAGLHRFIELMATEPSIQDAPDAQPLEHVQGRVDVNDVSFAYGEKAEVLHNVTLHIPAGETVALVGPSGGGKTTLCQLLPRFYDVDSGSITVDGRDVRAVTQRSLRRAIGIVQQDVFLFADTIRENIRYGRPDATDAEVEQAARQAEIYDDICAMPDGFDTYVGERGALLSGGQKQRVAIARVFLKAPPILILDEATSALDSVTEARIQGAFDRLARGRTTLIIAHRLSTIRSAGRILVIQDGVVAEQGSHQELLAKNGVYATLYRTQNLGA